MVNFQLSTGVDNSGVPKEFLFFSGDICRLRVFK
jgi:hypothetical protein